MTQRRHVLSGCAPLHIRRLFIHIAPIHPLNEFCALTSRLSDLTRVLLFPPVSRWHRFTYNYQREKMFVSEVFLRRQWRHFVAHTTLQFAPLDR